MGNQLLPNYTIEEKPQSSGGYSKLWKIHNAVKIGRGREQVSIFIFDKRSLDKMGIKGAQKEEIIKLLRQEVNNLAQLKSPLVLQLVEPIIEDPKRIVFVTERIQGSLSSFISSGDIVKHIQSELDIKIHLLELIEGISFLHSDARMVHLGISPDNIYIVQNGKWRLGGLVFSSQVSNEGLNEISIDFSPKPYDSQLKLYPNLSYSAPELTESPPKMCYKSDIFSFGMLLINLLRYKTDKNLNDFNIFEVDTIYAHRNNFDTLLNLLEKQTFYQQATQHVRQLLQSVIKKNPSARPTLNQIHQSEFFMDPLVQSINHLARLDQMDIQQQQAFITNLSKLFMKFESIVVKGTLLPKIMPLIKQEQLMVQVTSILVELLKAQDYLTKVEFNNLVWTHVKTVSQAKQVPAKSLYQFVFHLPDFYKLVQAEEVYATLIPLYLKCLECSVFKLQEVALGVTDCIVGRIDYVQTKNKILPRLLQMCLDQNLQTRTSAIATLRKIHQVFDKQSINDLIFPTIEKMRKLGFMNKDLGDIIFEIYSVFCEQMTNEILISKGVPSLLPYLMESGLTKSQVSQFAQLIKSLVSKIETQQIKFLKDEQPATQAQIYLPQKASEVKSVDESDFGQFNQRDENSNFNFNFEQVKLEVPPDIPQALNVFEQSQIADPFGQQQTKSLYSIQQKTQIVQQEINTNQFYPNEQRQNISKPENNIFDFDTINLKPLPQTQQFQANFTPQVQQREPSLNNVNSISCQGHSTKKSEDLFTFDQVSNQICPPQIDFTPSKFQPTQATLDSQSKFDNFSFQQKDSHDTFLIKSSFNTPSQQTSQVSTLQQQTSIVPQIKTDVLEIHFGDPSNYQSKQTETKTNKYDDLFNMDTLTSETVQVNPSLIEKPTGQNLFNGFDNFNFKKDYLPLRNEQKKIDNDWGF